MKRNVERGLFAVQAHALKRQRWLLQRANIPWNPLLACFEGLTEIFDQQVGHSAMSEDGPATKVNRLYVRGQGGIQRCLDGGTPESLGFQVGEVLVVNGEEMHPRFAHEITPHEDSFFENRVQFAALHPAYP